MNKLHFIARLLTITASTVAVGCLAIFALIVLDEKSERKYNGDSEAGYGMMLGPHSPYR